VSKDVCSLKPDSSQTSAVLLAQRAHTHPMRDRRGPAALCWGARARSGRSVVNVGRRCGRSRLSVSALLALAATATLVPGCSLAPAPAALCPPGQNRRTATLAGALPLNASSGLPSAGTRDGTRALFRRPAGVAFSRDGAQVAVADAGNDQIRVVGAATGNASTVGGAGRTGPGFADGVAGRFHGPLGLDFSPDGSLLAVADAQNGRIRLIEDALGAARAQSRTLAGGSTAGTADGVGTAARFRQPADVAFSPDGQWLVVADAGSHRVRMVAVASGATTSLAGTLSESGLADGTAGRVRFNYPCGVAFSPDGRTVAVADAGNHAVRLISVPAAAAWENATVRTLAGGGIAGFADGNSSSFSDPRGVSFSPDGSVVAVADAGNHAIRIVNVASRTTTTIGDRAAIASQIGDGRFGDGAVPAFFRPTGVAFSPDGKQIAVADSGNNAIRLVSLDCIECPAATYKGAPGSADCTQCPSNSTSRAGSQALADCLCRRGLVMVNGTCLACKAGSFNSVEGAATCTPCPAGTYSSETAAVSDRTCSPCPRFAFSDAGSASKATCVCIPGFSGAPGQDINCSACARGFYKDVNGSTACQPCASGTFSREGGASGCTACKAGSFSPVINATACGSCGAGAYSAAPASETCTACEAGKYSSSTGASVCADCPAGSYSDKSGALGCLPCSFGSFATRASRNCTACEVGKYSNNTGASVCTDCTAGSYSNVPSARRCALCPARTYSKQAAATVCWQCPVSAFATQGSSECLCNVGYSGPRLGQCIACALGKYKAVNGSSPCELCPRAKYSSVNASSACSLCPPFSTSREGSAKLVDCECNPGYTNAPQDLQPRANASSMTSSLINGSAASACNTSSACNTNFSTNVTANLSGFTATAGILQCRQCAAGTFKPTTGSAGCTRCAAGSYAGNSSAACISCPPFSVAPAGSVRQADCKCRRWYRGPPGGPCYLPVCPAGQYNRLFGGSDPLAIECEQCPNNSWSGSARLGRDSCACNAGYSGADGGPCRACDLGEYKAVYGSSDCTLCKANSYTEKDVAAVSCLNCPNNSYSFEGSSGPWSCACNQGYSGPQCVVPQNVMKRGECATGTSFRKFEMELKVSLEASSESELVRLKAKSAREIANYFGPNSTVPVEVDASTSASTTRRAVFEFTLKNQVEGDQTKFAEGAADQARALTAFLKLRGVKSARVADINVKCGAGNTLVTDFATLMTSKPETTCAACPIGTYKQLLDNSQCVPCPGSTTTKEQGSTSESACAKWAGQQLTREAAESAGYALSAIVASIVGVNVVGALFNTLGSLAASSALGGSFAFLSKVLWPDVCLTLICVCALRKKCLSLRQRRKHKPFRRCAGRGAAGWIARLLGRRWCDYGAGGPSAVCATHGSYRRFTGTDWPGVFCQQFG